MKGLKQEQIKSKYNKISVYFCKHCLSLNIRVIGDPKDDDSVCENCGRTEMWEGSIFNWREMWKRKYGSYPEESY